MKPGSSITAGLIWSLDETWQVRLGDFPDAPSLMFDAVEGVRYLVEFEAQPPQETAAAIGAN
ncbi:MAG: hypothetical protein KDI79_22720 [Anaerolineae bacterium]|nr:hypothetical protein [Anaerolineae bacterium]